MKPKAVFLLSGGLDSKILLAYLKDQGFTPIGVTLDYGKGEVKRAEEHAKEYGIEHVVIKSSRFLSPDTGEVPLRNLVMLAWGAHVARSKDADHLFYATHYPDEYFEDQYFEDCSPEFVESLSTFLSNHGVLFGAPFIYLTKKQMISMGQDLGVNFSNVQSCNAFNYKNCGVCGKCTFMRRAFAELEMENQPEFVAPVHISRTYLYLQEMRLYINNKCQKNCAFCCYQKYSSSAKTPELPASVWRDVIYKARLLGMKRLMFSGKEPLFDDTIFSLLPTGKKCGLENHINTNGINLKKYIREINEGLNTGTIARILVSINDHSTLKLIDDMALFDRPDKFQPYIVINEDSMEIVETALVNSIKAGIRQFYLRFEYPTKFSPQEEEAFLNTCFSICHTNSSAKDKEILIETPIEWSGDIATGMYWDAMRKYKLLGFSKRKAYDNVTVRFTFPHTECEAYYKTLTVLHDGTILGCAKQSYLPYEELQKVSIGNVRKLSPAEIKALCLKELSKKHQMCMPRWYCNAGNG